MIRSIYFSFLLSFIFSISAFAQQTSQSHFNEYIKQFPLNQTGFSAALPGCSWHRGCGFMSDTIIKTDATKYILPFITQAYELYPNQYKFSLEEATQKENAQFYAVGRFGNQQSNTALLIAIVTFNKRCEYFLMMYYDLSGKYLGYDIIVGGEEVDEYNNTITCRLQQLNTNQILIEKVIDFPDDKCQFKKYVFDLNRDSAGKKQLFTIVNNTVFTDSTSYEKDGIKYKPLCDEGVGFCIEFPYEQFNFINTWSESGYSLNFCSEDSKAHLYFYRNRGAPIWGGVRTLLQEYQSDKKYSGKQKITYDVYSAKNKMYVLSGYDEKGDIFYKKVIEKTNGEIIQAEISYPVSQKELYNKITGYIFNTLK